MDLDGKTALITGGGRGIGAAVAHRLAAAGAAVVVSARSEDQIEAVAAEIRADGGHATAVPCDVTDAGAVRSLHRAAQEWSRTPVAILVNNAGIADSRPLARVDVDAWDRLFAVNVRGVMLCTQAFLPEMVATGWGRVVNVASIAGKMGAPYITAYSASKHAVIGFTRSAAAEVAESGVTVNAVCPGFVDTEMTETSIERIQRKTGLSREDALRHLEDASPQKRLYRPDEVAYAVVALCHELAGGITGQSIVIDGGRVQA